MTLKKKSVLPAAKCCQLYPANSAGKFWLRDKEKLRMQRFQHILFLKYIILWKKKIENGVKCIKFTSHLAKCFDHYSVGNKK